MSRGQRLGLIALAVAVAVAVAAFVIARPSDDDEEQSGAQGAQTTEERPPPETPTATAESALPPPPDGHSPARQLELRGGEVVGGVESIEVGKGDTVRISISSDVADELHLHGYDLFSDAEPRKPARFDFDADIEGEFEIESHTAEDAGKDPLIARLVVNPW